MVKCIPKKRPSPRFKRLPKGPNGGIELLLVQSVDHLGKQGDVVEVKPGYAHNYLIPQGLATLATRTSQADGRKASCPVAGNREAASVQSAGVWPIRSDDQSITIEANANDEGHLYGSVRAAGDRECLEAGRTLHITTDQVRLEGLLKNWVSTRSRSSCTSRFRPDLKVWVVPTATDDDGK